MTWLAFTVEVHTTDTDAEAPERIKREILRALEHRLSAVTVEAVPPDIAALMLDRWKAGLVPAPQT